MKTANEEISDMPDNEIVCELLDKLVLRQLHLMEEKISCELNIESNINNGSIHLAKSRYIMGHSSVSTAKLPMESSPEFAASTICNSTEEYGVTQLKVVENDDKNTVNPIHWFGVLVPQNLHRAKSIFQNTINSIVECVNVQLQLHDNINNINVLKKYKSMLEIS